jgi:hypothetical protein
MQQVAQSDGFYRFNLQLAAYSSTSSSSAPCWTLGAHTNDERREWLEAVLNASRPADQQIWSNPNRAPESPSGLHPALLGRPATFSHAPPSTSSQQSTGAGSAAATGHHRSLSDAAAASGGQAARAAAMWGGGSGGSDHGGSGGGAGAAGQQYQTPQRGTVVYGGGIPHAEHANYMAGLGGSGMASPPTASRAAATGGKTWGLFKVLFGGGEAQEGR